MTAATTAPKASSANLPSEVGIWTTQRVLRLSALKSAPMAGLKTLSTMALTMAVLRDRPRLAPSPRAELM